MSIFSQFKTNKNAEENGVIVKFKANDDGTIPSFRIGRANRNNIKWVKTVEEKFRPYQKEIDEKTITREEANKLNLEIFVCSLLISWEHIQGPTGTEIECNYDNAISLFTNLPDLYEKLTDVSSKMENFLEVNLKEDEKN